MESKNIKVIDEHGIDRKANIICTIGVDGTDYVVYWIERDNDNDNVFVSKLIRNIDGTSNMLNIDDSSEKETLAEIVKELIKNAIDNEDSKLSGNSVTLPNGKIITISSVLFNKEQNINVQKTYITTVKKAVIKVSEDFYTIEVIEMPIVEPIVEPVKEESFNIFPEEPITNSTAPVIEPVVEPIIEPVVSSVLQPAIEPQAGAWESVSPISVANAEPEIRTEVPKVIEPSQLNAISDANVTENIPTIEPIKVSPILPNVDEKINIIEGIKSPEQNIPIQNVTQSFVSPEVSNVEHNVGGNDKLVFNATKETNLNQALGEISVESSIPVENIQPIRDFGVEPTNSVVTPVMPTSTVTPTTDVSSNQNIDGVNNQKAGFANNKFFMVIAITFFLASCVFLGYEVFNFFQSR